MKISLTIKIMSAVFVLIYLCRGICVSCFAESAEENHQTVIRFQTDNTVFYDPNEGSRAILNYICEQPYVVIPDSTDISEKINLQLTDYAAEYLPSEEGIELSMDHQTYLLSLAEDYYTEHSETDADDFLFSFSHRCRVLRCDDEIIAFSFSDYYDEIQNTSYFAENLFFDAQTGELLDETIAFDPNRFPLPKQALSGSCTLVSDSEFVPETTPVIDFVDLDENGETVFLCVSGEVRDILLTSVVFYDQCYEREQIWFCSKMKDEALQLKLPLPSDFPEYKLKFTDSVNGQRELFFGRSEGGLILTNMESAII